MSHKQKSPVMSKKAPTGRAVHRKSRVHIPNISMSPSTQKLLEANEQIVSKYQQGRKKPLVKIVISDK